MRTTTIGITIGITLLGISILGYINIKSSQQRRHIDAMFKELQDHINVATTVKPWRLKKQLET